MNNQQAIDRLVKHLEWGWSEETAEAIKMGIHALEENKWIPCSERMPEDNTDVGYIIWLLKNQKHYRDANSKGTMILLKVKLFEYHDKYMELGSIPPYAFENFCDMYESYHELGGNGTGTKMYEEIKDLHLNKKKGD